MPTKEKIDPRDEILARLVKEIEALKQEPPKVKRKSRATLKKISVEGTGSIFWETKTPMTFRQVDIEKGRMYQSADGKKIKLFFVNKNFPQAPVIGALEIQPGIWDVRVWNYDGGIRVPYGHSSNIAGFWKE